MTAPPISTDIPTPDPLRESPPHDRFCDLILNGGVASGIVYPWALVELARDYRFHNIGGNSVGAMAAALAAAAEYGRCQGQANAFEVLRRAPLDLAKEEHGRTKMLRLFQPSPGVRRLFALVLLGIRLGNRVRAAGLVARLHRIWIGVQAFFEVLSLYGLLTWIVVGLLALPALRHFVGPVTLTWPELVLAAIAWLTGVTLLGAVRLWWDLRALASNDYGLCTGKAQPLAPGQSAAEEALIEWLHRGIQLSAGRGRDDPPLTFADLWHAPRSGQPKAGDRSPTAERSIDLQMFSTNVTLGRPLSLPLVDRSLRLFFRVEDWSKLFPAALLDTFATAAKPYAPESASDPQLDSEDEDQRQLMRELRELPAGELPIAIAARMSLCFPLLFSCVPVYAIDYETLPNQRVLRRCLITDGGLCTNFPIHLFDAAHPRWPTFGLMLSRRLKNYQGQSNWFPEYHLEGRADTWLRSVPGAGDETPTPLKGLFGLLLGMLMTTLHWSDNLTARLPHVRNRVLRMALRPGEGHLNIAMPGTTILGMAHEYGTVGGRMLAQRFIRPDGKPSAAWHDHLYVRATNHLQAMREHLRGYERALTAAGSSTPFANVLLQAARERALRARPDRPPDPEGAQLSSQQVAALQQAVQAVSALEQALEGSLADAGPYQPVPPSALRLRARV